LNKSGGGRLILKLNSQDHPMVKARQKELLDAFPQVVELVLEQDDRIERGGCIVETESGFLDARLSTQFAQVVEALTKVVSP
jgi:flagellar assembly protein FliH